MATNDIRRLIFCLFVFLLFVYTFVLVCKIKCIFYTTNTHAHTKNNDNNSIDKKKVDRNVFWFFSCFNKTFSSFDSHAASIRMLWICNTNRGKMHEFFLAMIAPCWGSSIKQTLLDSTIDTKCAIYMCLCVLCVWLGTTFLRMHISFNRLTFN